MARAALELVEPGMTVMINDGSMAAVLGGMLLEKRPLTVITNNAVIIDELKGIGCDTARSVLDIPKEELVKRTDLEEETVEEVVKILRDELEK